MAYRKFQSYEPSYPLLGKDAIILGSQDPSHWGIVEPLPSYGRGIELPGRRYRSLVNGYMLRDVVITGDNGTIDGQGSVWWEWFTSHSLNYTRPHLVEFVSSEYVLVSNISLLNAPAYNIHPVYCSNVHIHNISVYAPPESPYTVGIVPAVLQENLLNHSFNIPVSDSSDNICIEDCNISMGHDAIAFKSGWDELISCLGSEMSGGISDILVEEVHLYDSLTGIEFRTTTGRGGYIKEIMISDVDLLNVNTSFAAIGDYGSHPDDKFDPDAFPVLEKITLQNIIGTNITIAGNFKGLKNLPLLLYVYQISPYQSILLLCRLGNVHMFPGFLSPYSQNHAPNL
ncbi:hypothetical protein CXB51_022255 [Gossypium anomalum]|uniref:Polygalacturonase n=1 Tax=Gossypium anomalum TaxID=47600 RepID=A0A8J6CSS7_9ROSI|nr:hypothetical protein CXB51_022255 [Gossypium anomalum]